MKMNKFKKHTTPHIRHRGTDQWVLHKSRPKKKGCEEGNNLTCHPQRSTNGRNRIGLVSFDALKNSDHRTKPVPGKRNIFT